MAGQVSVISAGSFGRLWWLPANGRGNGLDDDGWVAMLDLGDDELADEVLATLARAGVPAYAAPLFARDRGTTRIWVGASAHGRAEATLLATLPALLAGRGDVVR